MANLSISATCNEHCAYCFASDFLASAAELPRFVLPGTFAAQLEFLDRSGIDEARLLGGEPTLHPEFPQLVALAVARGKRIKVFSSGLMPEEALACLETLPVEVCSVLVNANSGSRSARDSVALRRTTLHRLGRRATLGFTIDRPDFEASHLLAAIVDCGCRRALRLGLGQPCMSASNRHVSPKQYRFIGDRIVRLAREAATHGIVVEFDCGFVPCMFSTDDLDELRRLGADAEWHCNPILDIDTAGRAMHCYPLSGLGSIALTAMSDAAALRRKFEARTAPYRTAGVFAECSSCPFKESQLCPGGCLAAALQRFQPVSFRLALPAPVGGG